MKKILLLLCTLLGTVGAMATDVTVIKSTSDAATYGSLSSETFTTNAASGMAGVTIEGIKGTTATSFAYGACLSLTSTASGTITMTAPAGYIITGYSLTARSNTYAVPYTLTPSAGGTAVTTSTGGVTLTTSGLDAQTASFAYSAASANSFYIPSMTISVMSASAQTVNVTYELWDDNGTEAISSEVKIQEANSELSVPTSWTSSPIYSYATQGVIGDTDCTIKVIRTKIGVVTTADLSNSKCYTIRTNDRGWWVVLASATQVTSTTKASLATSATDLKQQFAFVYYNDELNASNTGYYLYSVSEKKFISKSGSYTALTATPGDKVTLPASSGDDNYPTVVALNGTHAGISNGYTPAVITSWQSLSDGGNRCAIIEAADFDATEALAAIEDYFHPNYTVTYIVKDGDNNVLFTSEPVATSLNANITTLPEEYQLTNFYTYNNVDVTITSSGNTNVEFVATPKENPLVMYTTSVTNPYYYNLNIRSKYLVYNSTATGEVTLQNESEPFNADASWAFIGEPYTGFKLINKTKGDEFFLTYTSVVTGNNHGNNNIQFVAAADFTNQYWIIDTNSNGLVLRMKENNSIYLHHDSGNNFLRTCSVSEWSYVHTDAGSTIVESTDEDVLIALYDVMKDYVFGTAIGQYSAEGVTAEDANATIIGVGAAIENKVTSAYPDAYAVLVELQSKASLNTPKAGFYRLKNVATGKYLTATAVTGYSSTEDAVFANGNDNSVATVIELREIEGKLYMLNQNAFFNWVVADKSVGSGKAWVKTGDKDKYVNWLPGKNAGQIAFAICYGNGTGSYASYLMKGIYTTDENEAVIGGTDYTIDAAQWIFEPATSISSSISDAGYATFYAPFAVSFPSTVVVYTATTDGSALNLTEVSTVIPAATPVILEAAAGDYTFTIAADNTDVAIESNLVGNYFASTAPVNSYVLQKQDEKVGFFHVENEAKAIKANRAYLSVPSSTEVKAFYFDTADGIKNVDANLNANEGAIFNIAGQRVAKAQKGLYIMNGKKVLVK